MGTNTATRSFSLGRVLAVGIAVLTVSTLLGACGKSSTASTGGNAANATNVGVEPGTCPTDANTASFAKTKFVLHAGLGFGAFHRYLYKPFKQGSFSKGTSGRVKAFVKGGVAALFIKRQVRLTAEAAQNNPTLCKLISDPLAKFGAAVGGVVGGLKSGDTSVIENAQNQLMSVTAASGGQGVDIVENDNPPLTG